MPALTKATSRYAGNHFSIINMSVAATFEVFQGALVCYKNNELKPANKDDGFAGVAVNSGKAGEDVSVQTHGTIKIPNTTLTSADIGKSVYASDDNTLTLASANGTLIGRIIIADGTNATVSFRGLI